MASEFTPDVKFGIGRVLFIDIVGYSKLNIHEQSEQLETLKRIVRGTEQVRKADAEGKRLRLRLTKFTTACATSRVSMHF
jgi:hypothetical protein